MKQRKKNNRHRLLKFLYGSTLTVVGILIVPKVLNDLSNKIYKYSMKNTSVDTDDFEPTVIKKDVYGG